MKTKSQKKNKPIYEILPMFMYDNLGIWSPVYDRTKGEPRMREEHSWIVEKDSSLTVPSCLCSTMRSNLLTDNVECTFVKAMVNLASSSFVTETLSEKQILEALLKKWKESFLLISTKYKLDLVGSTKISKTEHLSEKSALLWEYSYEEDNGILSESDNGKTISYGLILFKIPRLITIVP